MQNSAIVAGGMISWAPLVMAVRMSSPNSSMCRLMFSMVTVASSTRMPTASARPPSVMTLMVWPSSESVISELSTARGIDTVMMRVERQLPRKTRIINPVSVAAMMPSRTTPVTEARTKPDWSPTIFRVTSGGRVSFTAGSRALISAMMSRVEAEPIFRIDISTPLCPSSCTTLVCGGEPLCTDATSRMNTTAPSTTLIGRLLKSAMTFGESLRSTVYS